jgi:hypothetical protein
VPVIVSILLLGLASVPVLGATLDEIPTRTVVLKERWHVGVDDDVLFGLLVGVDFDSMGNIYVLDSQQCMVTVLDRTGRTVRTLFGEGDGPGEVRRPVGMMVMDDGNVGVVEEFPGYLVVVDPQGNFVSKTAIQTGTGEFVSLATCMSAGGHVVIGGTSFVENNSSSYTRRTSFLGRLGAGGRVADIGFSQDTSIDYADIRLEESRHIPLFWFASTVGHDGSVYAVPDYESLTIVRKPPGGKPPTTVVHLAGAVAKRSKEEKDWWASVLTGMLVNSGVRFSVEPADVEPVVPNISRALQIDARGRLWAMENFALRPSSEGVMSTYIVIGATGAIEERVGFVAPHDGRAAGIFFDGRGGVVVVETYRSAMFGANGTGGLIELGDGQEEVPAIYLYDACDGVF